MIYSLSNFHKLSLNPTAIAKEQTIQSYTCDKIIT